MKVQYAELARADLNEIWFYVAQDSLAAADRLIDRLIEASSPLSDFPEMGVARDELGPGVRVLMIEKYLLFYRQRGEVIVIERILDGRRDIGPALL